MVTFSRLHFAPLHTKDLNGSCKVEKQALCRLLAAVIGLEHGGDTEEGEVWAILGVHEVVLDG